MNVQKKNSGSKFMICNFSALTLFVGWLSLRHAINLDALSTAATAHGEGSLNPSSSKIISIDFNTKSEGSVLAAR